MTNKQKTQKIFAKTVYHRGGNPTHELLIQISMPLHNNQNGDAGITIKAKTPASPKLIPISCNRKKNNPKIR